MTDTLAVGNKKIGAVEGELAIAQARIAQLDQKVRRVKVTQIPTLLLSLTITPTMSRL